MPIVIEAVSVEDYIKWVSIQTECKTWLTNKFRALQKK